MEIERPLTPARVGGVSLLIFLVLLLAVAVSLKLGTAEVSLGKLMGLFTGSLPPEDPARLIIFKIRLPRIILAGLVGFALSLGGVVFQAILRNPLADPFILGVSSGSAFAAVLGIYLGFGFTIGIPVMSFGWTIPSPYFWYLIVEVSRGKSCLKVIVIIAGYALISWSVYIQIELDVIFLPDIGARLSLDKLIIIHLCCEVEVLSIPHHVENAAAIVQWLGGLVALEYSRLKLPFRQVSIDHRWR